VNEIAPRAAKENNVTSFEVRLNFVNPQKALKIGMTADINFQTGRSAPKILVPTVAILIEDGKPGVLLVDEQQKPRFQPVELGNSSGDRTAILNGLESGTRVFIDLPPWADRRD
jgi:HlyD family secretion protein